MTSPFSNELISAYLDGELTAEEQARVEKQLGSDVELRRLCDELRALRMTLQLLPAANPAEDLADRVLRQAERRMLTGEEGDSLLSPTPLAAPAPATTKRGRSRHHWRLVAAAVASVAAMLLLALWLPGRFAEQQRIAAGRRPGEERAPQATVPREEIDAERFQLLKDGNAAAASEAELARQDVPSTSDALVRGAEAVQVAPGEPTDKSHRLPQLDSADLAAGGPAFKKLARNREKADPSRSIGTQLRTDEQLRASEQNEGAKQRLTLPYSAPAGVVDLDAHREVQTQQLISQLDKDQVLLVQVSLPDKMWRDSQSSIMRRGQNATPSQPPADAANWMFDSRHAPEVRLYVSRQLGIEAIAPQPETTLQNLVVVEGSLEEVQSSLTRLVAQPNVSVVAESAPVDQLQYLDRASGRYFRHDVSSAGASTDGAGTGARPGMGGMPGTYGYGGSSRSLGSRGAEPQPRDIDPRGGAAMGMGMAGSGDGTAGDRVKGDAGDAMESQGQATRESEDDGPIAPQPEREAYETLRTDEQKATALKQQREAVRARVSTAPEQPSSGRPVPVKPDSQRSDKMTVSELRAEQRDAASGASGRQEPSAALATGAAGKNSQQRAIIHVLFRLTKRPDVSGTVESVPAGPESKVPAAGDAERQD